MISQLGSLLLMISLVVAVYGIVAAALGARLGRWEFVAACLQGGAMALQSGDSGGFTARGCTYHL
jgi:hypothetical protein